MTWLMTCRQNGILRSFLRRHLAGKTTVASRNLDCFVKLCSPEIAYFFYLKTFAKKQRKFVKEDYNFSRIWREKFPMFLMLWILLYSWNKRGLLVAGSMLNLVRALNLSVRLTSTWLALKVRLHFRTCSHLFCFFFLFFAWKWIKTTFFRKALTSNQKKKLLVKLLPFFFKESLE